MSMQSQWAIFIFFYMMVPGLLGSYLAKGKGRNPFGWFVICAFFAPTVMVVIFQSPLREVKGHYRLCTSCNAFSKWRETSCKYCRTPFEGNDRG